MGYTNPQNINECLNGAGAFVDFLCGRLSDLTDQAVDVFAEYVATKPSPLSAVLIQTVCGAASRVDPQATAFANRAFRYAPVIVSQWLDPAETEVNVRWARDFWRVLQPFAGGAVYVNDLSYDDDGRIRSGYGASCERLAALKKKYDPDNFFRLNPNITPAP